MTRGPSPSREPHVSQSAPSPGPSISSSVFPPPIKVSGVPLRLRLAIPSSHGPPPLPTIPGRSGVSSAQSITPLSESPETPSSTSSPITGVVDLTKYIKAISNTAVAHGGLSDIYQGEKCGGPSVSGDDLLARSDRPVLVSRFQSECERFAQHRYFSAR
jgi:hypothetical protein